MSSQKKPVHPLVQWVVRYVHQATLRQRNDTAAQLDYQLNELKYEISELRMITGQQQSEIERLKTRAASVSTYDEKIENLRNQIAELERWQKGAIATIDTLISLQFNAFDDVDAQHLLANRESQRLARVKQHLKKLCRKRTSKHDGVDLGPLLDIHASEIPDSGTGGPNSHP